MKTVNLMCLLAAISLASGEIVYGPTITVSVTGWLVAATFFAGQLFADRANGPT